jgi:hypothetical protein
MTITPNTKSLTTAALTRLSDTLADYRFRHDFSPRTRLVLAEADSGKWFVIRWANGDGAYRVTTDGTLLFGPLAVAEFLEDN